MLTFVYAFDCKKLILQWIFLCKSTFQNLNLSVEKEELLLWLAKMAVNLPCSILSMVLLIGKVEEILEDEKYMVKKETLFQRKRFKIGFSAL